MTKRIAITLCAIIIGFSTIFISQSTAKADENTQENVNNSIIQYPQIQVTYNEVYKQQNGFTAYGINGKYIENINAIYLTGTVREDVTTDMVWTFTDFINVMIGSTYSVYIYSTCQANTIKLYSNEVSTNQTGYFVNRFYKFTPDTDKVQFMFHATPNHTENFYKGYYTLMLWQGDWELNSDIVNSLKYQIGFNEGKIKGYNEGYNKGSTDGYEKGIEKGIKENLANDYIFNNLKNWDCRVDYNNETKGDFILTSNNNIVDCSGYFPYIKSIEYENTKKYKILFTWNSKTNNKFKYGFKDLIFQGLPINTKIDITCAVPPYEIPTGSTQYQKTFVCYIGDNGKLFTTDKTYENLQYNEQTYITNINIHCTTYTITNGQTSTEGTNYDLKKYPNMSITGDKDLSNGAYYENGYNTAKDLYYNKWYIGRYQQGYNDGTRNAGNYTFLSLMGSVVDAPIKALSDMLNFDILGFNMKQFFYAIITVCIIVTIVKLLI